ncbi:MAG: SWIM zinc finger family protein [Bifidobacteriaceae bacterium]|nr:SWIM zinc finger family protein [Bifidobacteriaceae bacterium]
MSNWGGWYPPTRPIDVEGGIKARSKRGAIGQTWWSERFISVLESFGMGSRLTRGKNYARRGQVLDLWVEPGVVTADVQGSRRKPYRVRIGLAAFGKADWGRVIAALTEDAWYAAKLLAGQMPEEIVGLFESLGLSLFPTRSAELTMDCTCPDWSVPCKHLAAVFYLLAERFDEDPFEVLAWRGRDREELLGALSARRTGAEPADRDELPDPVVPLAETLSSFWSAPEAGASAAAVCATASATGHTVRAPSDALLSQLPPVGLSVRGVPIVEALRPAYQALGSAPATV